MQRRKTAQFLLIDGIHTSGVKSVELSTTMSKGSKNVIMTGFDKPNAWKGMSLPLAGKSGSRQLMPVGESYGGLGAYSEPNALGSITRMLAALIFSGSGAVFYDGLSLGATASSILQLKVLTGGVWSATFQAGLTVPSGAIIAVRDSLGAGKTGRLKNGSYSVRINKIRSATGARSNASETSNIVIVTEKDGVGKSMRVTFPAIGGNGADAWGIYASPRNFGSTGGHFLIKEVLESELTTIDGVPRSYEIEWTDGDLVAQPLAPIQSNAPPTCVFNGGLGDAFFVDGCYGDVSGDPSFSGKGGSTIAVSLIGRPEEFAADDVLFPPEPPTALLRGGDGFYYRFGKNSMGVVTYTGGVPALAFQLYWATIGINHPHNAVVAEGGRLYAKTGQRGLCRIAAGGEIDTSFANPVIDEFAAWTDRDTVLGWDENSQNVCFFHLLECWAFNSSQGKWGYCDLTGKVSGKVLAAVTQGGSLYVACEDVATTSMKIYQFNAGTGSVLEQRTDWHFSEETDLVRQIDVTMRSDTLNPVEVKLFANENEAVPVLTRTITPQKTGLVRLPALRPSIPNLRSYLVHLKQTSLGQDCGFEAITISGTSRLITR